MAEIEDILKFMQKENVSFEEMEGELKQFDLKDLNIPKTISIESTLAEINAISGRLYELHNKQKRDPIALNKIIALLELKTKIVGMMSIKPDTQALVDSEINTYKKRFIEIADKIISPTQLENIAIKLSEEGL